MFTAGSARTCSSTPTHLPGPGCRGGPFAFCIGVSLSGPFAGVFRPWSRRQILVWSSLVRPLFVTLTALSGWPRAISGLAAVRRVLCVLGVNRFFCPRGRRAPARGDGGHAGDGQSRSRRRRQPSSSFLGGLAGLAVHIRHRWRAGRFGGHPARRPRCYLIGGGDRAPHAPRTFSGPPRSRGGAAALAAGRTRDRGQGTGSAAAPTCLAAAPVAAALGRPAASGRLRDLAAHLDPLYGTTSTRRPAPLLARAFHARDHRRGDRYGPPRRW